MRKIILFVMMFALVLSPHAAEAKRRHHIRQHRSASVDRSAGYADIVIDAHTGRIVHETNSDELRHPASLTKMMTLYLAFQALESGRLNLGQYLPVSANAARQPPSKLGLRAGQRIRAEDAVLGLVTESANDAAVVMGEALGGSVDGFARMMTRQARALGMSKTVFRNPSGLPDPEQVTTAHDMAVLGASLIAHFPRFYPYFSQESFTYAGVYHHNHNRLMGRYDGMDGIKTGYIRASGFNLVASVKRDGTRLIGVVFGGRSAVSRDNQMAQLLDRSFANIRVEANAGRLAQASGEGDSNDAGDGDYLSISSKSGSAGKREAQTLRAQPAVQRSEVVSSARTGGDWGVQIGAYSDAAVGQQALLALASSMPGALGKADQQVQKVVVGGATLYRARMMSLDKNTARGICAYLVQRGKSCLTVEP